MMTPSVTADELRRLDEYVASLEPAALANFHAALQLASTQRSAAAPAATPAPSPNAVNGAQTLSSAAIADLNVPVTAASQNAGPLLGVSAADAAVSQALGSGQTTQGMGSGTTGPANSISVSASGTMHPSLTPSNEAAVSNQAPALHGPADGAGTVQDADDTDAAPAFVPPHPLNLSSKKGRELQKTRLRLLGKLDAQDNRMPETKCAAEAQRIIKILIEDDTPGSRDDSAKTIYEAAKVSVFVC